MIDIIDAAAVVIAVTALGLAIFEGRATRQHNRLSVRPELNLQHHLGGSKGRIGLSLQNAGLGPGRILGVEPRVAGVNVENTDDGWPSALDALGLGDLRPVYEVATGAVIQAGERVWLFSWPYDDESQKVLGKLDAALPNLSVIVRYSSLYNEKAEATYR
jgi:hypothetical protein